MKTRSVARAGMLCAVYGILLFFNTMAGLWMESVFPYLLALPILDAAVHLDKKTSLCALGAMGLLTWMLSGPTTWLIAGAMLLSGWIFGRGLRRNRPVLQSFLGVVMILSVLNFLEFSVLAALFGYDSTQDQVIYHLVSGWISWNGFLGTLAFIQAFLESFAMACLSILYALKTALPQQRAVFSLSVGIPCEAAWGFLILFPIWGLCCWGMLSFPVVLRDLLFAGWLICLIALIFYGCSLMVAALLPHARRWQIMLAVLIGFIPGINLIPAAWGAFSLIRQSLTAS